MDLARRNFVGGSLAAMAFSGAARAAYQGEAPINQVEGYGALVPDRMGLLDLPKGFAYQVISQAGMAMDDGFIVPDNFDGMGCFALGGGRIALVRNHELSPGHEGKSATGGDRKRDSRLASLPFYGRSKSGTVLPGGTTTVIWNNESRKTEQQFLSLAGTATNCAGGITPWKSWLSCEETVVNTPVVEKAHGWVFEVPARHRGLIEPVAIKSLGRFRHEAAVVDPATGIVYLTEDREDSLFYRFLPESRGQLRAGGKLQALALGNGIADTRNWAERQLTVGSPLPVRWIDIDNVESPEDDLRLRGHVAGAALFARGEGIHMGNSARQHEMFFTCTSGGRGKMGQVFRYRPSLHGGGELCLFFESLDSRVLNYGDNITVSPWGHLVVCEDRAGEKINHLRGITPFGQAYTIARLNADTELAGACFAPDGKTLFLNAYSPGKTFAITGPWRSALSHRPA